MYRDSPFSPSEARRQTKMLCQLQKKINEDAVQESFSPFSADGILHFPALIHLLSASLEAADILLSLKNQKQNHLCFTLQLVPLYSLLQEMPHDLAKPVGLKGKTSLGHTRDLGAFFQQSASPPRSRGLIRPPACRLKISHIFTPCSLHSICPDSNKLNPTPSTLPAQ